MRTARFLSATGAVKDGGATHDVLACVRRELGDIVADADMKVEHA